MPRWPAWILLGTAAACAYPAVTTPPPAAQERYRALGQEPGWNVTIENGLIDYVGNYGETRISAAARSRGRPSTGGATRPAASSSTSPTPAATTR
jgi:hypothetical protein